MALDWTAWAGIGMATRGSIPKIMAALGVQMLPPEAGIAWIRRELTSGPGRGEVVAPVVVRRPPHHPRSSLGEQGCQRCHRFRRGTCEQLVVDGEPHTHAWAEAHADRPARAHPGIGERAAPVREKVCRAAAWLGVELDAATSALVQ